eukprot:scpid79458/ scgid23980/ 
MTTNLTIQHRKHQHQNTSALVEIIASPQAALFLSAQECMTGGTGSQLKPRVQAVHRLIATPAAVSIRMLKHQINRQVSSGLSLGPSLGPSLCPSLCPSLGLSLPSLGLSLDFS